MILYAIIHVFYVANHAHVIQKIGLADNDGLRHITECGSNNHRVHRRRDEHKVLSSGISGCGRVSPSLDRHLIPKTLKIRDQSLVTIVEVSGIGPGDK